MGFGVPGSRLPGFVGFRCRVLGFRVAARSVDSMKWGVSESRGYPFGGGSEKKGLGFRVWFRVVGGIIGVPLFWEKAK